MLQTPAPVPSAAARSTASVPALAIWNRNRSSTRGRDGPHFAPPKRPNGKGEGGPNQSVRRVRPSASLHRLASQRQSCCGDIGCTQFGPSQPVNQQEAWPPSALHPSHRNSHQSVQASLLPPKTQTAHCQGLRGPAPCAVHERAFGAGDVKPSNAAVSIFGVVVSSGRNASCGRRGTAYLSVLLHWQYASDSV
jgi:hypothetical protein